MRDKLTLLIKYKWYFRVLTVVISLLFAAGGYFLYQQQADAIRQDKYNDLKAIADLKVSQIKDWLFERNADAKSFPRSPFFVDAVALWLKDTTNVELKDDITKRLIHLQEAYAYEDIFMVSTNGQSLLSAKGRTAIHDSITVQKIMEASAKKEIVFTDFYFSKHDNKVLFDIITPVINRKNNTIAVMILRREPEDYLYPLIQDWPTPSKNAETCLLRMENDSVVYLNELRHRKNTALNLKIPLTRTEVPAVQAALGRTGLFEGIDYRGVKVLSDIRLIPGTNWIMISKVDTSEIFAGLNLTAGIISGFTLLLIIIFAIGFNLIYNARQKSIYHELYIKEKELWGQQEKFKVTMDSLGEGIITLDTNGKVQYMNSLAEEMTEWNQREARGRELHDIYPLKNEETGQRENNILDKIYKHGIVKELANHTLLISKSGKEIPVMDTGAPIYDNDGTIIGVVIAFQDETEKRNQKRQLEESERRYRLLIDTIPDTSILVFDKDLRFLVAGGEEISKSGFDRNLVEGRTLSEAYPPEVVELFEPLYNKALKGESTNFEHQYGDLHYHQQIIPLNDSIGNIFAGIVISRNITERKLAEESLHLADTIITNMEEGVYLIKASDGTIVYTNQKFDKMFGYAPGELLGKHVSIVNAPTNRTPQEIAEEIITALNKDKEWFGEVLNIRKDGATFYCSAHVTSFEHKEYGKVWISIHNDITKTKQADEELHNANERFNRLVSELNDVVWTANLDGSTIVDVNSSIEDVYGITIDEFKANPKLWIEMVHPDDRQIAEASGKELFEKGKTQAEYRIVKPDGTIVWLLDRKSIIHDENGKPVQIGGIAKDITERKLAENEIRNLNATLEIKVEERTNQLAETNKNLYREIEIRTKAYDEIDKLHQQMDYIFGATKTGLSIVDVDYNLFHVNLAQQKIYGNFSGKKCYEYYKGFDKPCEECLVGKAIETQSSAVYETTYPLENDRVVQATCIPFIDKNGKQLVAEITVDITERKKIERLLAEAKTEAERANHAKSEFLSRMSHELRTPLNSILGFAQLLNRRETSPESTKRIDQIMNSGMHLLDLINEVLDLARIESGNLTIFLEPVQISGIIAETLDIVHPIAEKREVKLELAVSPLNNLFVHSDRQKLKQVLLNLVNNAVKYNRQGGEVEVVITQTGDNIRISVRDTGIGIAAEEQYKLFKPFERIGTEISEVEGTGLGLAVAKKLVIAMNGSIGVESEGAGAGSTFWIELPQAERPLERKVQTRNMSENGNGGNTRSRTILYIEDDISNIQLVEDILRTERPSVKLVTDMYGKNAVKMANEYKPGLILLDLDLPDLHGSKVLDLLQTDAATKSIPVVVLSADAMTHSIEQLMAAGAKHYLTKPLDVYQFLRVVDEIMNRG